MEKFEIFFDSKSESYYYDGPKIEINLSEINNDEIVKESGWKILFENYYFKK